MCPNAGALMAKSAAAANLCDHHVNDVTIFQFSLQSTLYVYTRLNRNLHMLVHK